MLLLIALSLAVVGGMLWVLSLNISTSPLPIPSACHGNCRQGRECTCTKQSESEPILPPEFSRCNPFAPDSYCGGCKRWIHQAGQEITPQTIVFVHPMGSSDPACMYISKNQPRKNDEKMV